MDKAAGEYLTIIDTENSQSWTLPPVLYLGGLAAFTIGDYENAEKRFTRLVKEFPKYSRNLYINDRDAPNPDFAQPVKPGVTKLLFYCLIYHTLDSRLCGNDDGDSGAVDANNVGGAAARPQSPPPPGRGLGEGNKEKPQDAFTTFQQFNQTATKVLLTQAAFAHWLKNRPHQYQRRDFYIDESYGETPDQMRATVLPKTSQLIKNGWEQLFPAALKKSGSLKMRGYLRELTKADAPLKEIAAPRLVEVDQRLIKYYFAQAKVLLGKHQFDATRKMYSRIIDEYPDSAASSKAELELPKVTPIAVGFFKKEADKNWRPGEEFMKPQTKAREFYEKAYKEDPDGPRSAEMLYHWAEARASEKGKVPAAIKLLNLWMKKYSQDDPLRCKATYLLGFFYGSLPIREYEKSIKLMEEVVNRWPRSPLAAEALWHAAFSCATVVDDAPEGWRRGLPYLERYYREYPKAPRWENAPKWIGRFKERMNK